MLWIPIALLLMMSVFHSIIGERYILQPVKAKATLPPMWGSSEATFRTIQATWHLVSALWFGLAAYLVVLEMFSEWSGRGFLIIFGVIFGILAIVPLVWDAGKHKTWIVFGIVSGVLLVSGFGIL